jgi:uncharacterized membrane protein YhhN
MRNQRLLAQLGYLGLAALDTYLAGKDRPAARRARFVTKPLLMPTLAASTRLAAQPTELSDGGSSAAGKKVLLRGTEAAQAFSWGGDVALLGRTNGAFLTGVGSFFVAHLCYIGGFTSARDPEARLDAPGAKAAVAVWVTTAPVMAFAAGRKDPDLRLPVAAYSGVLATMFATSTTLRESLPASARLRILAGTSLFLLSDSLLGFQDFLRKERSPRLESAVMATYTAGQWLIAEGTAAAARAGH